MDPKEWQASRRRGRQRPEQPTDQSELELEPRRWKNWNGLDAGQLWALRCALEEAREDDPSGPGALNYWGNVYFTAFGSWAGGIESWNPAKESEQEHRAWVEALWARIEAAAREAWSEMGGKPEDFLGIGELRYLVSAQRYGSSAG